MNDSLQNTDEHMVIVKQRFLQNVDMLGLSVSLSIKHVMVSL